MIERYSISVTGEKLRNDWKIEVPEFFAPRYNAAPTQLLPILTDEHPQGLSLFYWGTTPEWSKNKMPSEKVINVRAETIPEKPALKRAMMNMRCIIPADSFYAWKRLGKKSQVPYRVIRKDNEVFGIAGLWEEFENEDGQPVHTFMMLTVPADPSVASIHERMPLILSRNGITTWLDRQSTEAQLFPLIHKATAPDLQLYTVSPRIFDSSLDVPSLVQPTPPADQHGNLTLFS